MGIAIVNLALAYRLGGKRQHLEDAKRFMDTVISYETWGNAHLVNVDLSASWILFGLSLGYDWLKEELDLNEKNRIREKLAIMPGLSTIIAEKLMGKDGLLIFIKIIIGLI